MTYEEQLLHPEWKAKRDEIIERDMHMCQKCMRTNKLQVHHKYYEAGKMAWEYPPIALITLCDACHHDYHLFNKVGQASSLDKAFARLSATAGGMRRYSIVNYFLNGGTIDGEEIHGH